MPRKSYQRRSNQGAREWEQRRRKTLRRRQNHAAIKPKRASANAWLKIAVLSLAISTAFLLMDTF